MRKLALLLTVLAFLAAGCGSTSTSTAPATVQGSGKPVSEAQTVSSFNRVDIDSAFNATIELGPAESVTITVDDNVMPYVSVTQDKQTLKIGLKPNTTVTNATLQVAITAPDLKTVNLNGASSLAISGANPKAEIEFTVNGASNAKGDIQSDNLTVNADGASTVVFTGAAPQIEVNANGASNVDLSGLVAANAGVNVDGASKASVQVNGILNVDAKGASTVTYSGDTQIGMQLVSGASTLEQK